MGIIRRSKNSFLLSMIRFALTRGFQSCFSKSGCCREPNCSSYRTDRTYWSYMSYLVDSECQNRKLQKWFLCVSNAAPNNRAGWASAQTVENGTPSPRRKRQPLKPMDHPAVGSECERLHRSPTRK